jgi:ABC-2 type transport system permease protein
MTVITRIDPLSYGVDGLRGALIQHWQFNAAINAGALAGVAALFLLLGARLFSQIEV